MQRWLFASLAILTCWRSRSLNRLNRQRMRFKKSVSWSVSWSLRMVRCQLQSPKMVSPHFQMWHVGQARQGFCPQEEFGVFQRTIADGYKQTNYIPHNHAQNNCHSSPKSLCQCHWEPRLAWFADVTAKMIFDHLCCDNWKAIKGILPLICKSNIHVTSWTSRSLLRLRFTRRAMWQCVAKSLCDCHRHGHWEPRLWMILNGFANAGFTLTLLCNWRSRSLICWANCKAMQRWFFLTCKSDMLET